MKSYIELVQEMLNQRAIVDNRNIVSLSETSESVMIAFNQACEFMRDLHNWKWNYKEDVFVNDMDQETYPMPYGIVHSMTFVDADTNKHKLVYVSELTADKGIPCQWTHKWDSEEIKIAPKITDDLVNVTGMIMGYHDKNIAVLGSRTTGTLLERFDSTLDTTNEYLNVPEYIYDAYARCVLLKTRVLLNEGAQTTVFPAQQQEWTEAYNGLMSYAKTPLYESERMEI